MPRSKNKHNEQSIAQKKKRQQAFLEHFKDTGTIRQACEKIDVSRSTYHKWIKEDPDFVAEFESAKEDSNDMLLTEARRRAVKGVREDIYYKGEPVGKKYWHSDTLLMFLMKADNPAKYREKGDDGTSRPRSGGDRMQIHLKQGMISDERINVILCDLEEAIVDAGIGVEVEE